MENYYFKGYLYYFKKGMIFIANIGFELGLIFFEN